MKKKEMKMSNDKRWNMPIPDEAVLEHRHAGMVVTTLWLDDGRSRIFKIGKQLGQKMGMLDYTYYHYSKMIFFRSNFSRNI
jgi:hypothetical protein